MKIKFVLISASVLLFIFLPGCVKKTVIPPTSQFLYNNTPAVQSDELVIASTNTFVDSYGIYHLVGVVVNNTDSVVNSILLTIEIKDASGTSLLLDGSGTTVANTTIYPLLYSLATGEASPFEYSYQTTNGTPADFTVTISNHQTGSANRASLREENVQLMDIGNDWYYLTGELVNTGSQWVNINSLAGAVLDDSDHLISTGWTGTYTTQLAPSGDALGRDRTPFEVNFPNPGGSTKWKLFWDADIAENVIDYSLDVQVSNMYFDQYGSAHLVGLITNHSNQSLESMVVGGLYGENGIVVDANYSFVPIPIHANTAVPFSISTFGGVSNNPNLASLVKTNSAQFDPRFTAPPVSEFVDMTATDEIVTKDGASWNVNGSIINTSGKNLNYVTVVVMVLDSQNKLVAMEYTSIAPTGDSIAPGDNNSYSIILYLDPTVDPNGFTISTKIVGDVK